LGVYWVGPRNHVLDGGLDNHDRKGTIGEISGHETVYVLNVIRKRQHTCDAAAHNLLNLQLGTMLAGESRSLGPLAMTSMT